MRTKFEQWMKSDERKKPNTAYQYALAIDKISRHYSDNSAQGVDLYSIHNITELERISAVYAKGGRFSLFGDNGNGTYRNAIATYIRYIKSRGDGEASESDDIPSLVVDKEDQELIESSLNFSYERDLQSALISEVTSHFDGCKIFGKGLEGIEYLIGGKRIDVLLEHETNNELIAIELKVGKADFKVFGQISMYIGLLSEKFPEKTIKGVVIAGSIDDSLVSACSITDKISLKTYRMKLKLEDL